MSDPVDPADTKKPLTPANQNPWYVLMTLYGEQLGGMNQDLHLKNRAAWNAWACQNMSLKEREEAAEASGVPLEELSAWAVSKEEIQRRFIEAWSTRRSPYQSKFNLPSAFEAPRLLFYKFSKSLYMDRFVFPLGIDFVGSEFSKQVSLQFAVFSGDSLFHSCSFNSMAQFSDAIFGGPCGFTSTRFHGYSDFSRSSFKGTLYFNEALLANDADFLFTSFSDTVFDKTVFKAEANFQHSSFAGRACFTRMIFEGQTEFSSANFKAQVFFSGTNFRQRAYFRSLEFGVTTQDNSISFKGSYFEEPVSFELARFSQFPNFEGTILHNETIITAETADTKGQFWPKNPNDPRAAKDSCAKIRNNLAKQGLPEAEHFFYRKEMRFAGMAAANPVEKLAYWLFGALSDYGYSFVRPALLVIALWILGAHQFIEHFVLAAAKNPIGSGFGLSFSNLFPYFGLGRQYGLEEVSKSLPTVLKLLGGFQTVSGAVLLFLFALGLRTRFRMR